MKNFKLLLATTAILSMSAMGANASEDNTLGSIEFNAKATFVQPITISNVRGIKFGVLSGATKGDTITVGTSNGYTKTGSVTLFRASDPSGSFRISNSAPYGQSDMITDGWAIYIPDVELMNGTTYCGYISDFKIDGTGFEEDACHYSGDGLTTCTISGTSIDGVHGIGAKLYVDDNPNGSSLTAVPVGNCSQNVTATIIYYL